MREQQNEIQGNQANEPKENAIKLEQNNIRDSLAKNQAKVADENVKKEGFYDKNDDIPFYRGGKTLPTAAPGVHNTLQSLGFAPAVRRMPVQVSAQVLCKTGQNRAALACTDAPDSWVPGCRFWDKSRSGWYWPTIRRPYSYGYAFGASHEFVSKVILVGHHKAPG